MDKYFDKWVKVIPKHELKVILEKLDAAYNKQHIYPVKNKVFKAFKLCPYDDLKVVILSQDPYPQKDVATGIAFGNDVNSKELSNSLQIIKEAVIDYTKVHNYIEFDNSLESWCKQGVLMLNSALTVVENEIGSHTMLWRPFISKLLFNLSNTESSIIYALFGNVAQTFEPYINSRNNVILKEKHPSYYARIGKTMPNTIFKQIDYELIRRYGNSINWYNERE